MTIISIGTATPSTPFTVPPEATTAVSPGAVGPTGAVGAAGLALPAVAWTSGASYSATAPASVVVFNGAVYLCIVSHTAGASFNSSNFASIAGNVSSVDGGSF